MIEVVELVVTALTAGAVAGAKDTASVAVKDAYANLKVLTTRTLSRRPGWKEPVAALDSPQEHRAELIAALSAADAERDVELADAARRLLRLAESSDSEVGKYVVNAHHNKGVQIGDGNTMTIKIDD
ncbi:hypothetical protein [Amycolatopsis sp. NPDC051102]|uniref:hypothetical protein n=1 Tax=Amycolatopsis sp. NPDC051102 TaxID=3155163 RepID=UPI003426BAD6